MIASAPYSKIEGSSPFCSIENINGNTEIMGEETIDVDVQDKDGLTALHILCMKRDMTDEDRHIVEMILGVAKNINSVEKSTGFTCLHYVSRYEHEEIAEQLLRKGASASVVDSVCTLSTNLYPCSLLIILTYKTKLHTERASSASLGVSCKSIEDCKVDMRARFGREFEFQDTRWYDTDDLCFNIRDDRAHTLSCNEGMCSLYLFRSFCFQRTTLTTGRDSPIKISRSER